MAKISAVARNNKVQKKIERFSKKRADLKAIIMSKTTSDQEKFDAQLKLSKLPRNSAKVRYRNRCNLTGRPRGYYRDFGVSRIALRVYSGWGFIPGVTKSSW
jgi:small subunit ribosomal protein S14